MMRRLFKLFQGEFARLVSGGVIYIFAGSFISKFAVFFGSTLLARLMPKEAYGVLGYVENLFSYAYLFAGLGLINALFRYVVKAEKIEDKYACYSFVARRSTLYNIIITVVAAVVFMFFYPHDAQFSAAKYLLPILLVSLPFHSLFESNTIFYRSMFDNKAYALYTCTASIALIALKCLFAATTSLSGVFIAQLLTYLVAFIVSYYHISRKYFHGISRHSVTPLSHGMKREISSYSLQYMIANGLWAMFMLNEIFLLGRISADAAIVANYKVAYVFPGCLSLLGSAISIFVTPYFVKNENNHKWVRKNMLKTLLATGAFVGVAGLALVLLAKPLLLLAYGKEYVEVAPLMCILTLAASVNIIFRASIANVLAATGKVFANLMISIAGILVQILLIVFVTGKYSSIGVAWTTVAVYAIMSVALMIAFYRYYGKKTE